RGLDESFKGSLYTLSDLFTEARRRILGLIIAERLARFDGAYQNLYEESRPIMAFMRDSEVPIPAAIRMAAEYTLLKELVDALGRIRPGGGVLAAGGAAALQPGEPPHPGRGARVTATR